MLKREPALEPRPEEMMLAERSVQSSAPAFDDAFRARLADLFIWRRDVRRFQSRPVASAKLDALLEIAALAPSVGLSQPWRFVTVDDPDRRTKVRANFQRSNAEALAAQSAERGPNYAALKLAGLDQAPCHLALFCEPDPHQGHGLGRRSMPETTAYSAVMALHTLWLAARAEGLGLGWVSILDPATIGVILEVPAHWRFIGYFCIGYPEIESDTPELERLGWETRRFNAVLKR